LHAELEQSITVVDVLSVLQPFDVQQVLQEALTLNQRLLA
jgi:hypothetical protein